MKKGCFITGIAVVTVAIGVGSYVIKKYGPEFLNYGKEKVMNKALDDFDEYLNKKIGKSLQRDSIEAIVKDYSKKLKGEDFKTAMQKFGRIVDEAQNIVSDKIIESSEIKELKDMVEKDEGRKKN